MMKEKEVIKKVVLPNNGLTVVLAPHEGTAATTVLVLFGTGSRYETAKLNGISHYLEHMYFKGTKKRPSALKIATELDSMGSNYNAFTGKEYTGYFIKAAARHFEHMLDILSDMLFNPLFDPKEMEKEKGAVQQEINMYEDSPRDFVDDLYEMNIFGPAHPLGWFIAGSKENVRGISRSDLLGYLKSHYFGSNSVIVVSGHIESTENTLKLIKSYFGKMKTGRRINPKKFIKPVSREPLIKFKETEQTHMILGTYGFPYRHPKKEAYKLLAAILGGGMSSRLFVKIRERRGLAYYVRTGTSDYLDTGTIATQTGVENEKVFQAVSAITSEYRVLSRTITAAELAKAKEIVTGRMVLDYEDSMNVAMRLGMDELYGEELVGLEHRIKDINRVALPEIKAVADKIFRGPLSLALIGPFKNKDKFAKLLK